MWELWLGPTHRGRSLGSLLAAGWPEWVGTDGHTLGWVVRDRLFLYCPGGAARCWMVELPDIAEGVCASPSGWVVALGQGFVVVDPDRAEIVAAVLDDDSDPVGTRAGREVGVLLEAPSSRALRLSDGAALALPDGANRSRWLTPFASGEGVIWVDGDVVYRLHGSPGAAPRIAAVGRLRGVLEVCAGPEGAAVIRGRSGSLLLAPRGFGVDGPKLDAVRFSSDGARVLATDEDGAVELSLRDGTAIRRWAGRFDPLGWIDDVPWVHDRRAGVLRALSAPEHSASEYVGFCGAKPVLTSEGLLLGPGGARWTLGSCEPAARGFVDGVIAVGKVGGIDTIVYIDDSVQLLVDGKPPVRLEVDEPVGAAVVDGRVWIDTTAGAVAFGADGVALHGITEPPLLFEADDTPEDAPDDAVQLGEPGEDSFVGLDDGRAWPVPADDARCVGAAVWAWTDDGALYVLVDPAGA